MYLPHLFFLFLAFGPALACITLFCHGCHPGSPRRARQGAVCSRRGALWWVKTAVKRWIGTPNEGLRQGRLPDRDCRTKSRLQLPIAKSYTEDPKTPSCAVCQVLHIRDRPSTLDEHSAVDAWPLLLGGIDGSLSASTAQESVGKPFTPPVGLPTGTGHQVVHISRHGVSPPKTSPRFFREPCFVSRHSIERT
jgi:hypothetical protein